MLNTPVVLFVYKRLTTTIEVFNKIKSTKPKVFYLIADGPKNKDENEECNLVRNFIEDNINWKCKFVRLYATSNMGLANRIRTGLDHVFSHEDKAIILEDDTLPDHSFFSFCENLLTYYNDNHSVGHISGCNHYPLAFKNDTSYCFSSVINIWGWATWKRAWKHFDLQMPSWNNLNKHDFLKQWCLDSVKRKGMKRMFDLHCLNEDPWAWSYQWTYACYANKLLSVMPRVNLVSNLGIGPSGTNTVSKISITAYPLIESSLNEPFIHPCFERDLSFEKRYYKMSRTPILRKIKTFLKGIL